jgi:ferredoxin/flavodoxin
VEARSIKLVCFSPTGTTKAVVQAIARGVNQSAVSLIDITTPDARRKALRASDDELLVVGVPVYMGRVPALLADWLHAIDARNTPAVCVVVYGNRAYDDALLELKDILADRGCIPIAGGAYLGEHSFSSLDAPTAEGRPDAGDLHHAESFGRRIREKLLSAPSVDAFSEINLPGNHPYRDMTELWSVDFIAVDEDECVQCGTCAVGCPVGAIDPEDSGLIDVKKCITCCACIKNCPQEARTMKPGEVKEAAVRLHELYRKRKGPECFL